MCIFLSEKCRNVFSSCHQLQQAPGRLDPGAFHLLPSPARKFPQKTLTNPCPSGNIYRQSVRLRIEYGRVPEWPMGTDCKSAAFQLRWFESTRAHQTRKIRTCFRLEKGSDFSFSSGTTMKAPVDGANLRCLVVERKPITRFGGYDYEVR